MEKIIHLFKSKVASKMKLFIIILCCVLALHSSRGSSSILADAFDETVYLAVRSSLIEQGASKVYAKCVSDVLRAEDAAKELRTISNYFNPDEMMPKLQPRMEIANFLCRITEFVSPVPLEVVVIVIGALLLGVLIKILACCCCPNNKVQLVREKDFRFQKMNA